jgi:hypothetical protein
VSWALAVQWPHKPRERARPMASPTRAAIPPMRVHLMADLLPS